MTLLHDNRLIMNSRICAICGCHIHYCTCTEEELGGDKDYD
jgi:hypothetical protein